MWKAKNKQNVASLPRGAVGKGAFAEGFCQLRSATLGKIFPARVFPALPSIVARGSRQRIFFKKIKNHLCRRPLPGALGTGFFKENKNPLFADGLCQGRSARVFFQKIKTPLFADGPASRPSTKKIS
jgi:hypothetical protein